MERDWKNEASAAAGITLSSKIDDIFRKKIISGEWKADHRIPSEHQLAQYYDVSRSTIRTVVLRLVGEGLLYRVQGKGTFVSPPRTAMPFRTLGIREKLDRLLPTNYSIVTKARCEPPPEQVAALFHLPEGAQMFALERLRFRTRSSTAPIIYQYNYMPVELGTRLKVEALSEQRLTHQLRDRFGLAPATMDEWLQAAGANAVEARELRIPPGSPVLIMDELPFDEQGKPYTFNRFTFPANQLRLSFSSR